MDGTLPLILVEGVLVFGGVLAFAWWQFRDLRRERERAAAKQAAAQAEAPASDGGADAAHEGSERFSTTKR